MSTINSGKSFLEMFEDLKKDIQNIDERLLALSEDQRNSDNIKLVIENVEILHKQFDQLNGALMSKHPDKLKVCLAVVEILDKSEDWWPGIISSCNWIIDCELAKN